MLLLIVASAIGVALQTETVPNKPLDEIRFDVSQLPTSASSDANGGTVSREIHFGEPVVGLTARDREFQSFEQTIAGKLSLDDAWRALMELNEGELEVLVIRYQSPAVAWWEFGLNDPRVRFWKLLGNSVYWNLQYDKQNLEPDQWQGNPKADQETALCGNGESQACVDWFYQARFGQYYLWIQMHQLANVASFHAITDEIVDQIEAQLSLE